MSNKTSATISNETNIESPPIDGYLSSPNVTLVLDDDTQTSPSSITFQLI